MFMSKQFFLSPHFHVTDKEALSVLSLLFLEVSVCTPCRAAFDLNTHCGLVSECPGAGADQFRHLEGLNGTKTSVHSLMSLDD